ncbi:MULTISPECIES: hypothetical protein [unclassified Haladaptatus]|uniref:hypothetical protein n=1 Tax=unclassified Haladaptatus TaxID=2622732 RepID=UPI0023E7A979|nr:MULTISPECIES: hypothetical protein [unclassified Haladaptatus]
MERRTFLRSVGATASVASLSFAAGCSNSPLGSDDEEPQTTTQGDGGESTVSYPEGWTAELSSLETDGDAPSNKFQMESFDVQADDSGNLVVTGTVKNTASETATHAVVVHVDVEKESHKAGKAFELDGGATNSFELPFPVTMDEFNQQGSLRFTFQ